MYRRPVKEPEEVEGEEVQDEEVEDEEVVTKVKLPARFLSIRVGVARLTSTIMSLGGHKC
jgi:hypothetical protein